MVKNKNVAKSKETKNSHKAVGVQVISILHYISAAFLGLSGLLIMLFSNIMVSAINSSEANIDPNIAAMITPGLFIGIGIVLIVIAVLIFFIGRGLWKLKQWARICAVILSTLLAVYSIYSMILGFRVMQVIWLLIYLLIAGYLAFSKEAKAAFK